MHTSHTHLASSQPLIVMEEIQAEFTQHVLAEKDVECERATCESGGVIAAGQNRFYVAPKPDKNGITHGLGRWCCKGCFLHYRGQKRTVVRKTAVAGASASATTRSEHSASASRPDINAIRQSVNESQRQGMFYFLLFSL